MDGTRSGEPPPPSLVEEALQAAERATALLTAAVQAEDAHFLEHLEARRRAITWLNGIPSSSLGASGMRRLQAIRRGGEIVVAMLKRQREKTFLEIQGLRQNAPTSYSATDRRKPHCKNIDVKA